MTVSGYARVSTNGQDLACQVDKLKSAGCSKIWKEKISGAKTERPELCKLLKSLQAGDTLVVTRIDRFARSTRDLLNTLDVIKKAGASFKSLDDPWVDSSSPHGELLLTILGGIAQFERSLISARTSEGRAHAVARGVKLGPKPKLSPEQVSHARHLKAAGKSLNEIAVLLKISNMTVRRAVTVRGPKT